MSTGLVGTTTQLGSPAGLSKPSLEGGGSAPALSGRGTGLGRLCEAVASRRRGRCPAGGPSPEWAAAELAVEEAAQRLWLAGQRVVRTAPARYRAWAEGLGSRYGVVVLGGDVVVVRDGRDVVGIVCPLDLRLDPQVWLAGREERTIAVLA